MKFISTLILSTIALIFIEDIGVFVRYVILKIIGKKINYRDLYDKEGVDLINKQGYFNIILGVITLGLLIKGIVEILIRIGLIIND